MDASAALTSKGQITIPREVREALDLREGDRVLFRVVDGRAILARTPDLLELAGAVPVPPRLEGLDWPTARRRARAAATRRSR